MSKNLHENGLGEKGLSLTAFAERMGLSINHVQRLCRSGRIFGARKHPLTKKWWIYPPAKLLCDTRAKRGNTSNLMHSTSLDVKRA
jgi:transcriptional regulator with XRE-family HTH domain